MSIVIVAYEQPTARAAISRVLTDAGYDVLVASPGAAMAAARDHGIQVVITDEPSRLDGPLGDGDGTCSRPRLRVLYAPDLDE